MTRQRGPTLGYGKILRAVGASTWFKLTPRRPGEFFQDLWGDPWASAPGRRRQAAREDTPWVMEKLASSPTAALRPPQRGTEKFGVKPPGRPRSPTGVMEKFSGPSGCQLLPTRTIVTAGR